MHKTAATASLIAALLSLTGCQAAPTPTPEPAPTRAELPLTAGAERVALEIAGMPAAEARAHATANNVQYRESRIDDTVLPLTEDYRPDRVTVDIENGIVVSTAIG